MTTARLRYLRRIVPVVFALALATHCGADVAALRQQLASLVAHPGLRGATVGVEVASVRSGDVLFASNHGRPVTPASTMKLVSGAVALESLGPDYVFLTRAVSAQALRADGVLAGDLTLVGAGDPTLQTADLKGLAKQLQAAGLRRVTGDILADDSLFGERGTHETWETDDLPYGYAAEISALSLNWNCIELVVVPNAQANRRAEVRTIPRTGYVEIESSVRTVSGSRTCGIGVTRGPQSNLFRVGGRIGRSHAPYSVRRTIHDPDLYAAQVFREALEAGGMAVEGTATRGLAPENAAVLAQHSSAPLCDIYVPMAKHSANLTAEGLFRAASAAVTGQGSAAASAELALMLLREAGADVAPLVIADGSGLSRRNALTADSLVCLLRHMWLASPVNQTFVEGLPIAGVDGTLEDRMEGTPAENNLRAKTGTLDGVCALAGYVVSQDGELLAFAILMSGYAGSADRPRRIQDQIGAALAAFHRS
jgi:D-alanyl-D-alanine carboxypeptidase/D-alanyl-D-alanine-endopeptidase (penicillin-binding protein 4)